MASQLNPVPPASTHPVDEAQPPQPPNQPAAGADPPNRPEPPQAQLDALLAGGQREIILQTPEGTFSKDALDKLLYIAATTLGDDIAARLIATFVNKMVTARKSLVEHSNRLAVATRTLEQHGHIKSLDVPCADLISDKAFLESPEGKEWHERNATLVKDFNKLRAQHLVNGLKVLREVISAPRADFPFVWRDALTSFDPTLAPFAVLALGLPVSDHPFTANDPRRGHAAAWTTGLTALAHIAKHKYICRVQHEINAQLAKEQDRKKREEKRQLLDEAALRDKQASVAAIAQESAKQAAKEATASHQEQINALQAQVQELQSLLKGNRNNDAAQVPRTPPRSGAKNFTSAPQASPARNPTPRPSPAAGQQQQRRVNQDATQNRSSAPPSAAAVTNSTQRQGHRHASNGATRPASAPADRLPVAQASGAMKPAAKARQNTPNLASPSAKTASRTMTTNKKGATPHDADPSTNRSQRSHKQSSRSGNAFRALAFDLPETDAEQDLDEELQEDDDLVAQDDGSTNNGPLQQRRHHYQTRSQRGGGRPPKTRFTTSRGGSARGASHL